MLSQRAAIAVLNQMATSSDTSCDLPLSSRRNPRLLITFTT